MSEYILKYNPTTITKPYGEVYGGPGVARSVTNLSSIGSLDLENGDTVVNSGFMEAVVIEGTAGTITNLGSIEGRINLEAGGTVTNGGSSATDVLMYGSDACITISGGAGVVTNFGTIESIFDTDVSMYSGSLRNFGTIESDTFFADACRAGS
jgi:hypothetical protein